MAYSATIFDHTYQVAISQNTGQHTISLDNTTHAIDWRQITALAADTQGHVSTGGRFSLLINGISYDIMARRIIKADTTNDIIYEVLIMGQRFEVHVADERTHLLAALAKNSASTGVATLHAPMPGLVIALPYAIGTQVEQGQTVLVLEAMKMENDLAAPISGTIKELRVSKGQTVDQGDALIIISS